MKKIAYAQGVARALKDAGLIKVAINPPTNLETQAPDDSEELANILKEYSPPEVESTPGPDNTTKRKKPHDVTRTEWGAEGEPGEDNTLDRFSRSDDETSII
jgi:hypothetical protein